MNTHTQIPASNNACSETIVCSTTVYLYSETELGLAFEEDAGEKLLPKMNETKKLARKLKQKLSHDNQECL